MVLGELAGRYFDAHRSRISELLGGVPTLLTVVPSKRGIGYAGQPLVRALSKFDAIGQHLVQTLRYESGGRRFQYSPQSFARAGPGNVRGQRIVLFEDTWVTGATAVSAAGSLMGYGASSVVILPLARCVDQDFWPEEHPYRVAMGEAYDVRHWPRWQSIRGRA